MSSPMLIRQWIENIIRERIAKRIWAPGSRISEAGLAQELGISRGPIRESLSRLEAEGLVEHQPRRGCIVRSFSSKELRELATLRVTLEKFACKLVLENDVDALIKSLEDNYKNMKKALEAGGDWSTTVNQDFSFHQEIIHHANHSLLKHHWDLIAKPTFFFINIQPLNYEDLVWLANGHLPILDAFRSRSLELVEREVELHVIEALNMIETRD